VSRVADALVGRRKLAAVLGLVIVLGLLLQIRALPIEGSLAGFDVPDNPHRSLAESMADRFPPPPVIQIAVTPGSGTVGALMEDLQAIDSAVTRAVPGSEVGSLHSFEAVYEYVGLGRSAPVGELLEFAATAPVARDLLSRDGQSFMMLVRAPVEPRPDPALLDEILARDYPSIASTSVFSLGHLERDIYTAIESDIARLTLLILACAAVCVIFAYRSLRALVFVGAITGAGAVGALATQSLLGQSLDVATMLAVPTVLVLSLADAVHLLTGYALAPEGVAKEDRLRSTVRHYLLPSFLTTATTAGAFFSLLLTEASSLRAMGIACGISALLAFLTAYLLGPYLLDVLGIHANHSRVLRRAVHGVGSRARAFGLPLLALIPAALLVVPRLNFSTPPNHFFPTGSETTRVHDVMTARFYALSTIDILLTPMDPTTLDPAGPSINEMLVDLEDRLEALPGVYAAVSIGDVVAEGRALGIPSPVLVSLALDNPYTARDGTAFRIELRVDDASEIPELAEQTEQILRPYESRTEWAVTGITLAMEWVNSRVVATLLGSFAASTLFVVLVIAGLARTLRGTLVAVTANLVPLAAAVVVFGVLSLELSVLSASVLVLSMGLIVDDTLHVLFRLRRSGSLGELPYGMAVTSLIVAACFALFVTSSFPPVRILGGAIAGILLVALVADLTLVPWLYRVRRSSTT